MKSLSCRSTLSHVACFLLYNHWLSTHKQNTIVNVKLNFALEIRNLTANWETSV